LSQQDRGVNILTQLGLTNRQAEVYIATFELGQPTAKSIAQTLQIARSEAYRATLQLQKLGLIKKIIVNPVVFRAVPLSDGLSILLQNEAEKHKENRAKAEHFLLNFKNHNREKPSQETSQYCLTSGFKSVKREYLRDLSEAQTSKDCILEWRAIIAVVNGNFEYFKEILERGVKIRYITHVSEGTKMPQSIQTLTKTGSFEVKSASTIPKAGIDIFDKKLVHIITVPNPHSKEIEVLRSDNPAVVGLAQDYFEVKWRSATTLADTKKALKTRV
jgi:sugar-specific transcriptional regulator TrmB